MKSFSKDKAFFWTIITLSIFSIYYCFTIIGSPSSRKARMVDSTRITHLNNLSYKINNIYYSSRYLPENSADIPDFTSVVDPQTSTPYSYVKLSDKSYNICATFSTATPDNSSPITAKHKQGYDCLKYTVN